MSHRKTDEIIAKVERRVDEEAQELIGEVLSLLASGRAIRAKEGPPGGPPRPRRR